MKKKVMRKVTKQDILEANNILEEVVEIFEPCVSCGLCKGLCPTFKILLEERISARGFAIKLSDKVTNYGWPISSYGNHYPGKISKYKKAGKLDELLKEAPLYKSHSKYSFEEPIKYFTPSIGISEIIKLPEDINVNLKNFYLIGAMGSNIDEGDKSLYYFKLNQKKNNIEKIDSVIIEERIRDIKLSYENDLIIMVLENSPSIGFISIKK